jgi:hypothetical protein
MCHIRLGGRFLMILACLSILHIAGARAQAAGPIEQNFCGLPDHRAGGESCRVGRVLRAGSFERADETGQAAVVSAADIAPSSRKGRPIRIVGEN